MTQYNCYCNSSSSSYCYCFFLVVIYTHMQIQVHDYIGRVDQVLVSDLASSAAIRIFSPRSALNLSQLRTPPQNQFS